MNSYKVTWEIELNAQNAQEAARPAQEAMHNPEADTTTVFTVQRMRDYPVRVVIDESGPLPAGELCEGRR